MNRKTSKIVYICVCVFNIYTHHTISLTLSKWIKKEHLLVNGD